MDDYPIDHNRQNNSYSFYYHTRINYLNTIPNENT